MARPKTPILTEAELRIMRVLWRRQAATVREVTAALADFGAPAYTTVLSTLATLRDKGAVASERVGKADHYRPVISRGQAGGQALRHVLRSFFDGSPRALAQRLVAEEAISEEEWHSLWETAKALDEQDDPEAER